MNSKYIDYDYFNSRSIIAIPNRTDYQLTSVDNTILELKLGDEPIVGVNDMVSLSKGDIDYKYICNKIIALDDKSFLIQESNGNLCNSFIAPLVLGNIKILKCKSLYNCYINDEKNELYVVFKFSNDEDYMKLEEQLIKSPNYMSKKDYESGFVIFKFKMKDLESIVLLFFNGKYSKFPPVIKEKLIKYDNNIHIEEVLLKRQSRREALEERLGITLSKDTELASKPTKTEWYEYFVTNILNKHEV